VLVK